MDDQNQSKSDDNTIGGQIPVSVTNKVNSFDKVKTVSQRERGKRRHKRRKQNIKQAIFLEKEADYNNVSQHEPIIRQETKLPEKSVLKKEKKSLNDTIVLDNTDSKKIDSAVEENTESEEHDPEVEKEAQKLRQSLADQLEVAPERQGFLGHLFNWIQRVVTAKPVLLEASETKIIEDDRHGQIFLKIVKFLLSIVVFIILIFIVFWIGANIKVLGNIPNWFENFQSGGSTQQITIQQKVVINPYLLQQWGIKTAFVTGRNYGSVKEMVTPSMFNVYYFGKLKESTVYKETDMTAAFFFGEGKDVAAVKSRFEMYVKFLQQLKFSSQVKLDQYLNQSFNRDRALRKFSDNAKVLIDRGNIKLQEMKSIVANYTVSINNLEPNKLKYNTSFFTYMEKGDADTASTLLDNYVMVAQKEVKLKAQRAALQKLVTDYTGLLNLLKLRNSAIQANFDALVKDVKVQNVPGSGINVIQK